MNIKDCMDCKHHSLHGEYSEILKCAIGHKPRFYKPKGTWPFVSFDFGWKRICSDYADEPLVKEG